MSEATAIEVAWICAYLSLIGMVIMVVPYLAGLAKRWPTEPRWFCALGITICCVGSVIASLSMVVIAVCLAVVGR